ncbi:NUDIX hydrolase [Oricola thermophila]|uniref:NUDIX hydrolase n=1 Tax=Oricola thermophila TaxID=2742145 RepID=A0A6N1V8H7_9HYPH|nr:NUDIX hydrolase [Oricola thermophila]QKV17281.1 NUDIX hydrolase [Oricola thermophila]
MTDIRIHRLESVRLVAGEGAPAFAVENRNDIERYWQAAVSANPRLWNGPFFMFEDVRIEGGVLTGTGRPTDFATFLYWRDNGRPDCVVHITGTSLPVLADGALLAVRMAAHTANAGQVYFPAGSFDAADMQGGRFDVTGNISRELVEETGLEFREADAEAQHVAVCATGAIHVARRNRLPFDFEAARGRLERHQAETGDDEIESAVAIRPGGDAIGLLKPYARALAMWHFENETFR